MVVSPGKTPADNALDNQVIGRPGRTHSHSEVKFPLRPQVEVNGWEELLLLIFQWIETIQRSVGCVVLQSTADPLGEIEAHFGVG